MAIPSSATTQAQSGVSGVPGCCADFERVPGGWKTPKVISSVNSAPILGRSTWSTTSTIVCNHLGSLWTEWRWSGVVKVWTSSLGRPSYDDSTDVPRRNGISSDQLCEMEDSHWYWLSLAYVMASPFKGSPLTESEKAVNKSMSAVRVSVEWSYGQVEYWRLSILRKRWSLAKCQSQKFMALRFF